MWSDDRPLALRLLTIISSPKPNGDLALLYPGCKSVALAVPGENGHYEPVIRRYTDGWLLVRFLWQADSTHLVASYPGLPSGRQADTLRSYFPGLIPVGALAGRVYQNSVFKALQLLQQERIRLIDLHGVAWRVKFDSGSDGGWTLVGYNDESMIRRIGRGRNQGNDSEQFEVRVIVDHGRQIVDVRWAPHLGVDHTWVATATP